MNIEMVPIEIVGLKTDLHSILHTLRDLGCVQIDDLSDSPEVSARPFPLGRRSVWQPCPKALGPQFCHGRVGWQAPLSAKRARRFLYFPDRRHSQLRQGRLHRLVPRNTRNLEHLQGSLPGPQVQLYDMVTFDDQNASLVLLLCFSMACRRYS